MSNPTGTNSLLAALRLRDRTNILERCEHVTLSQDEILAEPGRRLQWAYFPLDSVLVLMAGTPPRGCIGVELIGSEGMLGASLALGVNRAPLRALVAVDGGALRMPASDLQQRLADLPVFEQRLRRYIYQQFQQMPNTAACAVFHVVERRLAYWLLMLQDRIEGNRIELTHESLAGMLGVRRSGVSTAAGVLQRHRLITYSRGRITILDRSGLEDAACGCYGNQHRIGARLVAVTPQRPATATAARLTPVNLHS